LWTFILAFILIGMGTSSLYFAALTTSAKNFVGHRAMSIAVPISAFGLSSFWEALLAGTKLFTHDQIAAGGDLVRELNVARWFRFLAVLLGVVGLIGAVGLMVIPPHLPRKYDDDDEPTEEDALLPRAQESETSSVMSAQSAREVVAAERRPFLTDNSTYVFALVLLLLLGTGEMFINCVSPPSSE
jgi:MFS family permease